MNGTAAREFSSVHAPSRDAVVREFTQLSPPASSSRFSIAALGFAS